jgi:hypothetical protein
MGNKMAVKYKKPKGQDSVVGAALFDLEKGVFNIALANANIGKQSEPVDFTLQFGDFQETVSVPLNTPQDGGNELNKPISLDIYINGGSDPMKTLVFNEEGIYTFDFYSTIPYWNSILLYGFASRDGFYTKVYPHVSVTQVQSSPMPRYRGIVDLDLDPVVPDTFNGTIFVIQNYFGPIALQNTDVHVTSLDSQGVNTTFRTDEQGRFHGDLSPGNYEFNFPYSSDIYTLPVFITDNYYDIITPAMSIVLKPNIYLYPTQPTSLEAAIRFPRGGRVIESLPACENNRWRVNVEPSGLIDGSIDIFFMKVHSRITGNYLQDGSFHEKNWNPSFEAICFKQALPPVKSMILSPTGFPGSRIIPGMRFIRNITRI